MEKRLILLVVLMVFLGLALQPSLSQSQTQVTLNPTDDASVNNWNNNATINGDTLYVSTNYDERSFLKFNLSSIPPDAVIINATLKLYRYQGNGNDTFCIERVLGDWNETSITYNTMPSTSPYACYDIPSGEGIWDIFDITSLVQGWVNGSWPNYGLMLKDPSSDSIHHRYYSKDYSNSSYWPVLEIWYEASTTTTTSQTTTQTTTSSTSNSTTTSQTTTTTTSSIQATTNIGEAISGSLQELVPVIMFLSVFVSLLSLLASLGEGGRRR